MEEARAGGGVIRVEQQLVDDTKGDCFAACLASILEVSLDQVPNPHGSEWWDTVQRWLWNTRRLACVLVQARDGQGDIGPALSGWPGRGLAIVSVPSVLFEGKTHAVVYDLAKHEVVWDPSPKRDLRNGEYPPPRRFWMLVPAAGEPA